MVFLYCLIGDRSSTIDIRAMASKTTTTNPVQGREIRREVQLLLWKMRATSLLVKEGAYKALLSIEKKPSKMENDDWNDIDFR